MYLKGGTYSRHASPLLDAKDRLRRERAQKVVDEMVRDRYARTQRRLARRERWRAFWRQVGAKR